MIDPIPIMLCMLAISTIIMIVLDKVWLKGSYSLILIFICLFVIFPSLYIISSELYLKPEAEKDCLPYTPKNMIYIKGTYCEFESLPTETYKECTGTFEETQTNYHGTIRKFVWDSCTEVRE